MIVERELGKTQRVFREIERNFDGAQAVISPVSGASIPIPEGTVERSAGSAGRFRDAAVLLAPAMNQLNKDAIIGGFMAAKQVFPAAFKGLGPAFFGRIAPLIGPGIQMVAGIHDAYSAHREAERQFEREKNRRLALAQQIADAGRKMRWALNQQCQGLVESVFAPIEDSFAKQAATLKGQAVIIESDRAVFLKCKARLSIELE